MLDIAIDRDSVHAGDDIGSHATSIKFDPGITLGALFEKIKGMGYLPSISGGHATWIVCSGGKPIGVVAQQWPTPELAVPQDTIIGHYFADNEAGLQFRYWCQKDPAQIFAHIEAGDELPSRF